MEIQVNLNNKNLKINKSSTLKEIINDENKDVIACLVDNNIKELSYKVENPCKIVTLTLKDDVSTLIYRKSLCYLLSMAVHSLYPDIKLRFSFSISRCYFISALNSKFDDEMINKIDAKMREIVNKDYIFERLYIDKVRAVEVIKKYALKAIDKIDIFKYRPEKNIHLYKCDNYYNYFYQRMVYSTGYLKYFNLIRKNDGILLQYPRAEENGKIPPFEDNDVYFKALCESENWGKEMSCNTIATINEKFVDEKSTIDFINECEARHSRLLVELGNIIENRIKSTKLIAIAGPSSSGKTTFANRLRIELLSRGINPIMISLDNYYLPRNKIPRDEKGEYDFETINALNIDLFNQQMNDLLNGKKVVVPTYSFGAGESTNDSKPISLKSDKDVIIIEGIHALNDLMTKNIKKDAKFKIYISPQIQVNIDNENPLSLTDFRLLRRIIRDYKFRSTPPLETIKMWPNVRKGEFKWIYDGIKNADYVFNSFSFYELSIYSTLMYKELNKIDTNEINFPIVERLLRMLKHFSHIDLKWVPCNSLIREFIGGSCFY